MDCPRGPKTDKFDQSNCQRCRRTDGIGHYLRSVIANEASRLGEPLDYKSDDGSAYNFICPHFPWNYESVVRGPDNGEPISIEGVAPLGPSDCQEHGEEVCTRFGTPLSTRVSNRRKLRLGEEMSICELCLLGGSYQEALAELFREGK